MITYFTPKLVTPIVSAPFVSANAGKSGQREMSVVADAFVTCHQDRILAISQNRPDGEVKRLDQMMIPGLVNAHTHLEFSGLKHPLGEKGMPFTSWVGEVIRYRQAQSTAVISESIAAGMRESESAGVVAIGEISTSDQSISQYDSSLVGVEFRELIGFRQAQLPAQTETANHFRQLDHGPFEVGLSPHAPYSIHPQSVEMAVQVSAQHHLPLAMHLAETQEELQFLLEQQGPFYDLLNHVGVWEDGTLQRGTRPLDYLRKLTNASRALIIHGNYLEADELEWIAEHGDRLHLIYCPRTHHYFGHSEYPIELIRKLKIPLAIGTDSRASNPDLSILKELEFLVDHGLSSPAEALQMGTIHGAMALGLGSDFGTLQVGKRARFTLLDRDHCFGEVNET